MVSGNTTVFCLCTRCPHTSVDTDTLLNKQGDKARVGHSKDKLTKRSFPQLQKNIVLRFYLQDYVGMGSCGFSGFFFVDQQDMAGIANATINLILEVFYRILIFAEINVASTSRVQNCSEVQKPNLNYLDLGVFFFSK